MTIALRNEQSAEWDGGIAEMVRATVRYEASNGHDFDPRLVLQATPAGLGETFPSEGGFLVDTQHSLEIWEHATTAGAILRRCRKQPITTRANKLRLPTVSETSRANGSRAGGFALAWLEEAESFPQTSLKFGEMNLIPKMLGGIVYLTSELQEDSPAFNAWFPRAAGTEIAMMVEDAIVNGSGSGQPLGLLASQCAIEVAGESGQPAGTVRSGNAEAMAQRLYSASYQSPGTVWLANNDTYKQMLAAQKSGGAPLVEFVGNERYALGWPIIVTEAAPELNARGDLILVDLDQYIFTERETNILGSIHLRFTAFENALRIKTRCDGQIGFSSAITPKSGSLSQSPIVVLSAR